VETEGGGERERERWFEVILYSSIIFLFIFLVKVQRYE